MPKYSVLAVMETFHYLEVEAENIEEAICIGRQTDEACFIADEFGGVWSIQDAIEVD